MSAFLDTALDPATLERARAGDEAALAEIYRVYEVPVRTLARRIVTPRSAAEDVAQDVFVDVITRLHQFEGRDLHEDWQAEGRPGAATADRADAIDLERALAQLGDKARAVVWLHDVEGCTHAEIGAQFGASASFSKSQLARAHERLRHLLHVEGDGTSCFPVSSTP